MNHTRRWANSSMFIALELYPFLKTASAGYSVHVNFPWMHSVAVPHRGVGFFYEKDDRFRSHLDALEVGSILLAGQALGSVAWPPRNFFSFRSTNVKGQTTFNIATNRKKKEWSFVRLYIGALDGKSPRLAGWSPGGELHSLRSRNGFNQLQQFSHNKCLLQNASTVWVRLPRLCAR